MGHSITFLDVVGDSWVIQCLYQDIFKQVLYEGHHFGIVTTLMPTQIESIITEGINNKKKQLTSSLQLDPHQDGRSLF